MEKATLSYFQFNAVSVATCSLCDVMKFSHRDWRKPIYCIFSSMLQVDSVATCSMCDVMKFSHRESRKPLYRIFSSMLQAVSVASTSVIFHTESGESHPIAYLVH